MTSFKDQGRLSKAWWIQVFKKHGDKGGPAVIRAYSGLTKEMDAAQIQAVADELTGMGYLARREGPVNNRNGKRSVRYEVSSFGHRYLEEHKDELTEKPSAGKRHAVPSIPDRPLASIPRTSESLAREDPAELEVTAPPTPVIRRTAPPATTQGVIVPPKPKDFRSEFRRVTIDILLERYADKVTAKEVMDRLEAEQNG